MTTLLVVLAYLTVGAAIGIALGAHAYGNVADSGQVRERARRDATAAGVLCGLAWPAVGLVWAGGKAWDRGAVRFGWPTETRRQRAKRLRVEADWWAHASGSGSETDRMLAEQLRSWCNSRAGELDPRNRG